MNSVLPSVPDEETVAVWVVPLIIIGTCTGVGFVADWLFREYLRKEETETSWEGDRFIARALKGWTAAWFAMGGAYWAMAFIHIAPATQSLVRKSLLVLIAGSVTLVLARIAADMAGSYSRRVSSVLPSTSLFQHLVRLAVYLVGVLIILQTLGVSITPILTALGVGGLAVALALQDTLSNLFAAIQIIATHQIKPGDFVKLESGQEGRVTDINWRNTSLRTITDNIVVIPNSRVSASVVENFAQPAAELDITVEVGVGYDSDLAKVEQVTADVGLQVLKELQGGVPETPPKVRFHTFGDSSIVFTAYLRVRDYADQYLVKHEFIKRLHKRYNAEGISLPFPTRTVHLKKE